MREQYLQDIQKKIEEANLIVVGLGEEWDISLDAKDSESYKRVMSDLQARADFRWLLPYVYYCFTDEKLVKAYQTLFNMLEGKNYYVVTTTMNRSFTPFVRDARYVMPCGTDEFMRDDVLSASINHTSFMTSLDKYIKGQIEFDEIQFIKDNEGNVVPFNNIYAPSYKEEGYLPQWSKYMMWLQGTMNRKVCILELGVGLNFTSVIRFPFEKLTFLNQKSVCFRVHKSLYQLAEGMAERSYSIPMHAVELFSNNE